MLTIYDRKSAVYCDGMTRRGFLSAGAMALGGLTLGDVLRLQAESPAPGSSRPKSAILIYLSGGPSHIDMYDMKPDAPAEFRGEFHPIATSVPGMSLCELMPLQAKIADKFSIINGMRMAPFHSANEFFSGYPWDDNANKSFPGLARRPAFGSVVSRMWRDRTAVVPYVSVNNPDIWERAYYAGAEFEPFRIQSNQGNEALENMSRHRDLSLTRLDERSALLTAVDQRQRELDRFSGHRQLDAFQSRAIEIVASEKVRDGFDVEKEPAAVRERYGQGTCEYGTHPGKPLLQARRLIEAGVSVVTTSLHGWDTHSNNFIALRNLLPLLDKAVHALVTDLDERGMLNDVAIVMGGEFGRQPRIGDFTSDGRGHWSDAGFMWMAGGGLKTGQVVGATDAKGERSTGKPYVMQDILATLYKVLGIDTSATLADHNGRPQFLLDKRDPITQLV